VIYHWEGWFDGRSDCVPPEPGKYWIEILDQDHNEICIIVHRTFRERDLDNADPEVLWKEKTAQIIVEALNWKEREEAS